MVIDIHTHCFPQNLAARAVGILAEKSGIPAYTDGTIENLKKSMHLAGIGLSVLQPIATKPEQTEAINRWVVGLNEKNIIGFGTIHPDYSHWKDEIKWLAGNGIKGVKFHPDYQDFFVDEERLFPIYQFLFEAGFILLFHAGIDIGIPGPCHCPPSRLKNVLDLFPGSKIIAAHMGGYLSWNEVEKHLVGSEVYLDTSYSFKDLGAAPMERLIRAHGTGKILFGSDSPWSDQSREVENIKSLNLSSEEISMILGGNAGRLLRLL